MILAQIALVMAALLAVLALAAHFRITARKRRLGGFYVVPDVPERPADLRAALKIIEGGKH